MKEMILAVLAAMLVFSVLGIALYIKNNSKQKHNGDRCPVCDDRGCTCAENTKTDRV